MNCCSNCFVDKEIKGFILSNSTNIGDCDFCHSLHVQIIDCKELDEMFEPIISLFTIVDEDHDDSDLNQLHSKIRENWNIFNIDPLSCRQLLISILENIYPSEHPLFSRNVKLKISGGEGALADIHMAKWENFANEIKFKNRFFLTETIDLELLEDLLAKFSKQYNKGKRFYRARLSGPTGYPPDQMGKPPIEKTTSGRANPFGIPYLYLSTNMETAIYECRSSYLDFISIAELKLKDDLQLVSLRDISSASPFAFGDQLEYYLSHQKYVIRLEKELSWPVRRFDKELDYLPSQYLCEFVKSRGYDAIEYGSSLYNSGINLAVFNDNKLDIETVRVYEISSVDLKYREVE
jgi:hypothetical protein